MQHLSRAVWVASLAFVLSACENIEDTTVVFVPASGVYTDAQTLTITLPSTAKNVYLTTDTRDPIANTSCGFAGEPLTLDRATLVKLRFDVQGKTYHHERMYIIDENPQDNRFTNRSVVEAWENFFVTQVYRKLPAIGDQDAIHTLTDDEGGTVTRHTRILDRSIFFDIPTEGSQTYTFNFFEKADPDTGEIVMLNSGTIYGYLDEEGGYYTTLENRGGERLKYAGTYNGWAEGDFTLNDEGKTSGGYYKIFCRDFGCADVPVIYALGSQKQLLEISPVAGEHTRTCSPAE